MSLLETLPVGAVIGLDSAAFIYFIEEHPLYEPLLSPLFEQRIEHGENQAVTSVVTLAEVLVQPKRVARDDLAQKYREFLTAGANLMLPTSPPRWPNALPHCGHSTTCGCRMQFKSPPPSSMEPPTSSPTTRACGGFPSRPS